MICVTKGLRWTYSGSVKHNQENGELGFRRRFDSRRGNILTRAEDIFKLSLSYMSFQQSRCAYVIVVMAMLWLTEAIPIPVTALLPIFMFPMLQVADAKAISAAYITDTSMLFLGGLMLAVAVEEWNFHKRIALSVMGLIGAHPSMLMIGLMLPTWFLSMWISNTAATSMMIPIIQAVVHTLEEVHKHAEETKSEERRSLVNNDEVLSTDTTVTLVKVSTVPALHVVGPDMSTLKHCNTVPALNTTNGYIYSNELDRKLCTCQLRSSDATTTVSDESEPSRSEDIQRLAKGLALSVAYAANIGGIATLTGSPPNLVLKQQADELYNKMSDGTESESPVSFATWMGFAFPLSLVTLVLAWFWLQLFFLRGSCFRKTDEESKNAINTVISKQSKALGFLTFAEGMILFVFVALVTLWLFRDPPSINGWGATLSGTFENIKYISDSTPAILISVFLFILPARLPGIGCLKIGEENSSYTPLLSWSKVEKKVSWGVIILLGGGFAIAKASQDSGLSDWLGNELKIFAAHDPWVMNLIFCLIIAGATNVTSNTAMATLLMPILASVALTVGIHPLYLMISATIACSFAFMLPVATPPNAIVFSTGYLSISDMAIPGLPMNVIAVLVLTLAVNTWGGAMYSFSSVPEYFLTNTTATV